MMRMYGVFPNNSLQVVDLSDLPPELIVHEILHQRLWIPGQTPPAECTSSANASKSSGTAAGTTQTGGRGGGGEGSMSVSKAR